MDEIESGHFFGSEGELISEDGQLLSLGDLIRCVKQVERIPLLPCTEKVLAALQSSPNVGLYLTRAAHWAKKVPDDFVWDEASRNYIGRNGLLDALSNHWKSRLKNDDGLYPRIFDGGVALLMSDAEQLFPQIFNIQDDEISTEADNQLPGGAPVASGFPVFEKLRRVVKDAEFCKAICRIRDGLETEPAPTQALAKHYGVSGKHIQNCVAKGRALLSAEPSKNSKAQRKPATWVSPVIR